MTHKECKISLWLSIFRLTVAGALIPPSYFFPLPTNFLVISWALVIISVVILLWDIYEFYERRHCESTID
jgi:hypothetical protein